MLQLAPADPPPVVQTFADPADRARLTPAAVAALRALAMAWALTGAEAADLLGISVSTRERIRTGQWRQSLSQDQFMRASAMIGLYKGLHLLFADGMAERWVRLRNSGPLFGNLTPQERQCASRALPA